MIPNSPLAATILCRRPMLVQRERSFPCDSTNAEGLNLGLTWTDSLSSGKQRSLGAKPLKCARFYVLLRGKRRAVACAGRPATETSCYYMENPNDLASSNGLRSRTRKMPAVTRVFSVDEDTAGSKATFQVMVASGKSIMGYACRDGSILRMIPAPTPPKFGLPTSSAQVAAFGPSTPGHRSFWRTTEKANSSV